MQKFKAIKYIRLSYTDDKSAESNSVSNQRKLIDDFLTQRPEIEVVCEKVDDGYSGVLYDRPAFMEMMELIKSGAANCVIVKDLSRLGREYIETGRYLRRVFPAYGVRFIAINDDFDTAEHKGDTGGIDIAFKYLLNECFSRDMLVKSKTAKLARMKRGEYQSKICPYGYQKGANGRMVPDAETADNVRQIFEWAADGASAEEITRKLCAQKIQTPGEYKASKGQNYHDVSRTNGRWTSSTVLRILADERYTGVYIWQKECR